MAEEMESPVEKLQEEIHHAAEEAGENWLKWCAMMAALYAVMAAISGLVASSYANDAMMEQIQASDQWGYYQAKGIKRLIVESESKILKSTPQDAAAVDAANKRSDKYRDEEDKIKEKAEKLSEESHHHMEMHEIVARSVTCFQVAIAMIGIVILTRRRKMLVVSALLGLAGAGFLLAGMA